MSLITFLLKGTAAFPNHDARTKYTVSAGLQINHDQKVDPMESYGSTKKQLSERVQFVTRSRLSPELLIHFKTTTLVDGFVLITTPSEAERRGSAAFWNKRRQTTLVAGAASFVVSTVSTIGVMFWKHPYILTAFAVASMVICILSFTRMTQARKQQDIWNINCAHEVAYERKAVFEEGFFYMMTPGNCLRRLPQLDYTMIVAPEERQFLHKVAFQSQKQVLEGAEQSPPATKGQQAREFIMNNPLSAEAIAFAYPHQGLDALQPFSQRFEAYRAQIRDVGQWYNRLQQQVRTAGQKARKGAESLRQTALEPISTAFTCYEAAARKKVEDAIPEKERISTNPNFTIAQQACDEEIRRYQAMRDLAKTPINLYFDQRIQTLEQEERTRVAEIQRDHDTFLAPFYSQACALFNSAYSVYIENQQPPPNYGEDDYAPPAYQDVFEPSAPPPPNFAEAQAYRDFMRMN